MNILGLTVYRIPTSDTIKCAVADIDIIHIGLFFQRIDKNSILDFFDS